MGQLRADGGNRAVTSSTPEECVTLWASSAALERPVIKGCACGVSLPACFWGCQVTSMAADGCGRG